MATIFHYGETLEHFLSKTGYFMFLKQDYVILFFLNGIRVPIVFSKIIGGL